MKLAILCQEEPVFLGPFLQRVIRARPHDVAAVFIAGKRKAGEKDKTFSDCWHALRVYWLILGPLYFFKTILLRLQGMFWGPMDLARVAYVAEQHGIPVYHIKNPNDTQFQQLLRQVLPDVVLNQSEMLLKKEVLSIPKYGFINRHASLLPRFRGRLASFWGHAANPPSYGVTIHFVDEGLDTGAIVLQRPFIEPGINPCWSYPKVMNTLMRDAHTLLWQAVDQIQQPGFHPLPIAATEEEPACRFPTVEEAKAYRQELTRRRQLQK